MSDEQAQRSETHLISLTAKIVAAFVRRNQTATSELPAAIESVYRGLQRTRLAEPVAAPQTPAVPIKKSVHKNSITCLECGAQFQSMRRHLRTAHRLTPQAYRDKWKLPADYPIVAATYAELRSRMAKEIGLGKRPEPASSSPPAATSGMKATRKRKPKQAA
jgi:predicted transcriptional regulator